MINYLIPILSLAALCAGWVLVQLLAKKMKTKNHFDHLNSACGHCTCGGVEAACEKENTNTFSALE
jgi:hypothetical protein